MAAHANGTNGTLPTTIGTRADDARLVRCRWKSDGVERTPRPLAEAVENIWRCQANNRNPDERRSAIRAELLAGQVVETKHCEWFLSAAVAARRAQLVG